MSSKNEYVSDINQAVRIIKDIVHTIRSSLQFHVLPSRMIIVTVIFALMWLNAFPLVGGVFATYSLRNIILWSQLDYIKDCCLHFGMYTQVHDNPDPINITDVKRMTLRICMLVPLATREGPTNSLI